MISGRLYAEDFQGAIDLFDFPMGKRKIKTLPKYPNKRMCIECQD